MDTITTLPDPKTCYRALVEKDAGFDGIFFAAITTTGIFCRPVCTARKPRQENVRFFPTARDALGAGFRPCRICRPMEAPDAAPEAVRKLLAEIEADSGLRLRDAELRARGIEPTTLRRWFKRHHGMTFQSYARALRIGAAFGRIRHGETATTAAFDHGWESLSGFGDAFRNILGSAPTKALGAIVTVARLDSPLGPLLIGATDAGICLLEFADRRRIETQLTRLARLFRARFVPGKHCHIEHLADELARYFAGELRTFTVPIELRGTAFQRATWEGLRSISYGETRSYAQQAKLIGRPTAVRAVARANGDNRIAIVIPCHRVVGANGSLTGYGGGLWRKQWLLALERRSVSRTTGIRPGSGKHAPEGDRMRRHR